MKLSQGSAHFGGLVGVFTRFQGAEDENAKDECAARTHWAIK